MKEVISFRTNTETKDFINELATSLLITQSEFLNSTLELLILEPSTRDNLISNLKKKELDNQLMAIALKGTYLRTYFNKVRKQSDLVKNEFEKGIISKESIKTLLDLITSIHENRHKPSLEDAS